MSLYAWRGTDSRGTQKLGVADTDDLPAWVRQQYDAQWRDLVVTYHDGPAAGNEAGRITRPPGKRQRTWWAADENGGA